MLALLETPAGFALFRIKKSRLLEVEDADALHEYFSSAEAAQKVVELHAFSRFKDTKQATEEVVSLMECKLGKGLKKFLKKNILSEGETAKLMIADKGLGACIKAKLGVDVIFSPQTHELLRGIKAQLSSLIEGLEEKDCQQMAMSLSHSLNRFKLRFSPEKLDTMIIQAVALLDDLDRELNNFAMRLKEWYGWHFPELSKVLTDNLTYAKAVQVIGFRTNAKNADLEALIPDERIASEVRLSAETSMGTEMTEEDLLHIISLAARVEELVEYRANLAEYLKVRMKAVAPNLTYMVGEVIGARLMAHSGSLLSLSKQPASTVQILGAEKALFRALKTKSNTPKYGIIYHAALVGQAPPKLKGKISRVLAAKLSLCVRVDALTEAAEAAAVAAGAVKAEGTSEFPAEPSVAISCRRYVEHKLELLEQQICSGALKPSGKPALQRYEPHRATNGAARKYDSSTDAVGIEEGAKQHKKHKMNGAEEEEKKPKKKKIKIERADL